MQPLEKSLRNKLENTVKNARIVSEAAAKASLEQIGVGEAAPFSHLSESERDLRRRLRAHGRQLGDVRSAATEVQQIDRLIEEVAYEHWHRMLFARFLAENNLLMYPDPVEPVAVTLEECEDLAADEGAANGWELAARFASKMLPQIFRPDSPVLQLVLPPEHQQRLERLVADLPSEVFTASDSLGWVYQFWQAKRKDEVNASEVKIGARELPAVTQLFTEPYMVSFLLDNSLGAWWAARRLSETDLRDAAGEEELRDKAAIAGVSLEYLRFVQTETGAWSPAAGTFDSWSADLSELKTLDPCCGSGHFLVAALLMLVPMRMELEGLSAKDSVDAVLRENLHGLELDQRCVELAAFALALTAWRYPNAGGYRRLPELNVACSGLSVGAAKEEWKALALDKHNLRLALDWMYEAFKDAPVLGSLLNPARTDAAKVVQWEELKDTLEQALGQEQSDEQHEAGVVAQGLAKAATLLAGKYQWVITNVPYKKTADMISQAQDFFAKNYKDSKATLETVFLERCIEFCADNGTTCIVIPQNWLFLTTYRKLREKLLSKNTWRFIARLGSKAFQTPMWDFNVQLLLISNETRNETKVDGLFNNAAILKLIRGLDVASQKSPELKTEFLKIIHIEQVEQDKQLNNPDARIALEETSDLPRLEKYANCFAGVLNGDSPRFQKQFWEIANRSELWTFQQTTVSENKPFGGLELILNYDKKNGHLREEAWIRREKLHDSDQRGNRAWGYKGIGISQMNILPVSLYTGETFDSNIAVIFPKEQFLVLPIWTYCQSNEYHNEVRRIDQKINVTNATLVKVPFDLEHWTKVAEEKYPNGLPKPYSDDPTQWIFHGHPAASDEPLQTAVARLLGYRFPAELDAEMELADEARTLIEASKELLPFADEDGIVCLPSVRGEASAAERLLNLLAAAYGADWSNDTLSRLLTNADHAGKTLETWLREKFFTQHCKTFQHRPFIWHIWDGLRDGFAALVNYHKLDYKNLETLIYTYLGDWITRQKQDITSGVDGAQEKLAAAEALKKKLELILKGESPHDIFVRWKPLAAQPIGWNPDLNDGVRMNIRPFLSVPDVSKKGAGVLRDKPNIKWDKDRGKDVESAPWFHKFSGDRINDHHLSLEEKKAAREE